MEKSRKAKIHAKEAEKKMKKAEKAKKMAEKEVKRAKTRRTLALMAGAIYDVYIAKEEAENKKAESKRIFLASIVAKSDIKRQRREMKSMENQDGDVGVIIRDNNLRAEALLNCRIPSGHRRSILTFETKKNTHDGDDVEFFLGLPDQGNAETSCFYVKRIFNMSETLRPLIFVGNKLDYIIYTGLSLNTPVFIKVSTMRRESDLIAHRYSVHMQKKVYRIFKDNKFVNTPKLLEHNTFKFDGGRGGVQAATSANGITVGQHIRTEIVIDSIVSKTAVLLREMHKKGVVHGDAHMENFLFDGLTGKITAIDLERSVIWVEHKNMTVAHLESAKLYDIMISGLSLVASNGQNKRTNVPYDRILELFMKKYLERPATSDEKWWTKLPSNPNLQVEIGKAYEKLFHPILQGAIGNIWEQIKHKAENRM